MCRGKKMPSLEFVASIANLSTYELYTGYLEEGIF